MAKKKVKITKTIRIKKGSVDASGREYAAWVYKCEFPVLKISGDENCTYVHFANEAGIETGVTDIKNIENVEEE